MRSGSVFLALATSCAVAACGGRGATKVPVPTARFDVAPGARLRGASLFGTDVFGLPNGLAMTPDAAPGSSLLELDPHISSAPGLRAGNAVATALSPDGSTLLVLTSGYNRTYDARGRLADPGSSEYVFVYDVSEGAPRETQVVSVPNSFGGLAFDPVGIGPAARFYVSGGSDDNVHLFGKDGSGRWHDDGPPIALGHLDKHRLGGLGLNVSPFAAGLGVSLSGATLVVANHENDSVTMIDTATRAVLVDVALAPGGGVAGGEFPAGVLVVGDGRAFITCQRDREVVEVDLRNRKVARRIRVGGQPTKLVGNRAATRIYVANANSDSVSVIDTVRGVSLGEIATSAPKGIGTEALRTERGSNPNALALSPDEKTLYVTNGGNNTVAVVSLAPSEGDRDREDEVTESTVVGLVPTGFYPNAISVSRDGRRAYVAHGKSPTGPNPLGPWSSVERSREHPYAPGLGNQFSLQLTHGGLLAFPIPKPTVLAKLTAQSVQNNRGASAKTPAVFTALRGRVKHVIYVISENRSYDQILGDVQRADGEPSLVHWGDAITPNQHALARDFVTLDRFFDSGGVSGDGWQWTVSGRTTDVAEKAIPVEYGERGHHSYDWEGTNRNINVGRATLEERLDYNPKTPRSIDLLPGNGDVGAVDGPAEGGRGFLWDVAMGTGLTYRNYGCFVDDSRYGLPREDPVRVAPLPLPEATKTRVAFPTRASLQTTTDPYYRGFDMAFADYWRFQEWAREFDAFVKDDSLPSLETIRLPHDHLGSFATAEDGLSTPDAQIADHDYALGLIVERVSHSRYWESTVIVALEDDAQNGSDHVDAHRSLALFAGGHIKRGGVVSTPYTTVSVLKTIELLLGMPSLGQHDSVATPMSDVLEANANVSPFDAVVPGVLRSSRLPLPPPKGNETTATPRGTREYWSEKTAGFDFSREDAVPTEAFNHVLACGLQVTPACDAAVLDSHTRKDDDD